MRDPTVCDGLFEALLPGGMRFGFGMLASQMHNPADKMAVTASMTKSTFRKRSVHSCVGFLA